MGKGLPRSLDALYDRVKALENSADGVTAIGDLPPAATATVADIALDTSDAYSDAAVNAAVNAALVTANANFDALEAKVNAIINAAAGA